MAGGIRIFKTIQIGDHHINHCEDYIFATNDNTKIVAAVMDGCSMGVESYFASALTGKVIQKVTNTLLNQETAEKRTFDCDVFLEKLIKDTLRDVKYIKNLLHVDKLSLLTTLLVLVYDKITERGVILSIGDGLASINGTITRFDHDNKPDYYGYHLEEDIDQWYSSLVATPFGRLLDVSISTDGIYSFQQTAPGTTPHIDPTSFLLHDQTNIVSENMLDLKVKSLEQQYSLKAYDDIGIVRLVDMGR